MLLNRPVNEGVKGRSPQGERGFKYNGKVIDVESLSRSPQGERGFKYWCTAKEA